MNKKPVLLSLLFSVFTYSQECPNVRMDQPGGSMEHVSVRSQYLGTCYAYAALAAYDALRFTLQTSDPVDLLSNPLHALLLYEKKHPVETRGEAKRDVFFEAGSPFEMFEVLMEKGVCLNLNEDDSRPLQVFLDSQKKDQVAFFHSLLRIVQAQFQAQGYFQKKITQAHQVQQWREQFVNPMDQLNQYRPLKTGPEPAPLEEDDEINYRVQEIQETYQEFLNKAREKLFSEKVQLDPYYQNNLQNLFSSDHRNQESLSPVPIDTLVNTLFGQCQQRSAPLSTTRVWFDSQRENPDNRPYSSLWYKQKFIQLLTESSSLAPQPIVTSLCHRILLNKSFEGLEKNPELTFKESCGKHAVLVIGSRPNPRTKRCEFLVRNSWGPPKDYSVWELSEDEQSAWVDADAFSKNIYHYFQAKLRY